jgi:hypothetical protein
MLYTLRCLGQSEHHIVILAAVIFTAELSRLLQKSPFEGRKMANVVDCHQVVRRKVSLKMDVADILNI